MPHPPRRLRLRTAILHGLALVPASLVLAYSTKRAPIETLYQDVAFGLGLDWSVSEPWLMVLFGLASGALAGSVVYAVGSMRGKSLPPIVVSLLALTLALGGAWLYRAIRGQVLLHKLTGAESWSLLIVEEAVVGPERHTVRLEIFSGEGLEATRARTRLNFLGAERCEHRVSEERMRSIIDALTEADFLRLPKSLNPEPTFAHAWAKISIAVPGAEATVLGLREGASAVDRFQAVERALVESAGLDSATWWECCLDGPPPRSPCTRAAGEVNTDVSN